MATNRARVEGSICEAYLAKETSQFLKYYFSTEGDGMEAGHSSTSLSIFKVDGRPSGKCKVRHLTEEEYNAAHLHVLMNCQEVGPYYK
jgi:hypothetical protein